MAAPASIPKFFNPENPPTPGGWHYWLDPTTKRYMVRESSPQEVVQKIAAYQRNNGQYQGDGPIEQQVWAYWCSREPSRCQHAVATEQVGRADGEGVPKEVWGPILWQALNWFAVKYDRNFFSAFVERMRLTDLIPCPDCRAHFNEICRQDDPALVTNQFQACRFAWRVHNATNRALDKPQYDYADAVRNFGFPTQ